MKKHLKKILMSNQTVWIVYKNIRMYLRHLYMLRFYFYDIYTTYKYMFWSLKKHKKIESLKSEILFQFHKLEKGIIMPGKRRVFGEEIVLRIVELLNLWADSYSLMDPVYLSAVQTLKDYKLKIVEDGFVGESKIIDKLNLFLESLEEVNTSEFITPIILENNYKGGFSSFQDLVSFRRSVREFDSNKDIDVELIEKATKIAQQSPSVCNRQASKIYYIKDRMKMDSLLSKQNGNAGFDQQIQSLAVISVDQNCFFNATERNQPYVDGGLFTMSFLYALSAQGLSSCCLNWCVTPSVDVKVHEEFGIAKSERIMMLVAIGYPATGVEVPLSSRKQLSDVLIKI